MSTKTYLSIATSTLLFTIFLGVAAASAAPLKSSIQTSYIKGRETQEEINTPRLRHLAKVTAQQAINIARKRCSGTVKQVDLENEDGNIIWSVEIGTHELSIDAGNGKILAVE